ncbi:MAG: 50S ribosomal protein L2 [bacterium]|nr:50S ribosomal protein L2 [bacterium]
MPLVIYKPTSAARRKTSIIRGDVSKRQPEKRLLITKRSTGGRNSQGRITVRHRGNGVKRRIRIVDEKRLRYGDVAKVVAIEYDPNRNARLALLEYGDGVRSYIIAPHELPVGAEIVSGNVKVAIRVGNRMPLEHIPTGMLVHDVELQPGQGGKVARGAGVGVQLMAIEGKHAQLKMPSGEIRMVPRMCAATIGQVGNIDARLVRIGKAGRNRRLGIRPTVRGKVMNPVDHPHGGGEGRNSIGLKYPKTPWGKHALGVKTRRPKKWSNTLIVRRRKSRKKRK